MWKNYGYDYHWGWGKTWNLGCQLSSVKTLDEVLIEMLESQPDWDQYDFGQKTNNNDRFKKLYYGPVMRSIDYLDIFKEDKTPVPSGHISSTVWTGFYQKLETPIRDFVTEMAYSQYFELKYIFVERGNEQYLVDIWILTVSPSDSTLKTFSKIQDASGENLLTCCFH